LGGKDLIGIAQTGTGKTLAFSIPMIEHLAGNNSLGLILLPTRELALQVDETVRLAGRPFSLQTAVLIGGEAIFRQLQALKRRPSVIIATPGRLIDHLERKSVNLQKVSVLVLDEADRMFDMGFAPQIKEILEHVPRERQTMLFSATMPPEIMKLVHQYMHLPVRIETAPQGKPAENVTQELFIVSKEDKKNLLLEILQEKTGTVLVFTRTKYAAKALTRFLIARGITAAEIHSNRTLAQRKSALEGFKKGRYRILVATDIAARGIDVTDISLIVNFDLPDETENYVHRIGRTARAGKKGHAVSFATPDQELVIRRIEKMTNIEIQVSRHHKITVQEFDLRPQPVSRRGGAPGGYKPFWKNKNRGKFSGGRKFTR
ncbi:MAG: DEAD/DEAH box helicase, partial [Thermodesulfobacteriota bacterium]